MVCWLCGNAMSQEPLNATSVTSIFWPSTSQKPSVRCMSLVIFTAHPLKSSRVVPSHANHQPGNENALFDQCERSVRVITVHVQNSTLVV